MARSFDGPCVRAAQAFLWFGMPNDKNPYRPPDRIRTTVERPVRRSRSMFVLFLLVLVTFSVSVILDLLWRVYFPPVM
ncbi:hypothetical protein FYK55_25815 [Roseiconus nitratireducens]|uniref:Uncharacterized protein n=1 Tax=Roseiconus nitratireducens TaxID=2605748 RepID=A0A5M6D1N3_9BACT|nr:hypothetical protein [Roseiconus nitratireducens]KAA5539015.1 hypothetical protein FYK55_25815 [Roseiconus nitratireducens]